MIKDCWKHMTKGIQAARCPRGKWRQSSHSIFMYTYSGLKKKHKQPSRCLNQDQGRYTGTPLFCTPSHIHAVPIVGRSPLSPLVTAAALTGATSILPRSRADSPWFPAHHNPMLSDLLKMHLFALLVPFLLKSLASNPHENLFCTVEKNRAGPHLPLQSHSQVA